MFRTTKPSSWRILLMTAQFSDVLVNNFKDNIFEGLHLYGISLNNPLEQKEWVPYPFQHQTDPKKKHVSTACWRGAISVYELNKDGELILVKFEYPSLSYTTEPDSVCEKLEGDFWLGFRSNFQAPNIYIPFIDGKLVTDSDMWRSDNVLKASSKSRFWSRLVKKICSISNR
jgi:hypothetical protein